ncbi:DNA mismatch repair protein MutL [Panus rudis PR-1116 ss-1]|nr:DNA mismatch repair protein MutL [Panus rudis PR-1116 ss-1]
MSAIKAIDTHSVHKITSGQVVVDLPTAVKELVENSLDAGATNLEVRFREYGVESVEVVDNGSGIAPEDYDAIALKHHTSKLDTFENLPSVSTFGFRGEALSALCALSQAVTITTATTATAPMGTILEFDKHGRVTSKDGKVARKHGTTVKLTKLFHNLPVRRKELEKNAKREFGKALNLLNAYALVPCAMENKGVRLTVTNQVGGRKTVSLRTDGTPSVRSSVTALWGPKSLENIVDLNLSFNVETEKSVLRRQGVIDKEQHCNAVQVRGLISKFTVGGGRTGTDRQFFFVNGRPCTPTKVQKAFNEVYRTFNANQSPFIVADFLLPKDSLDINVSPDKRTIFIHSENNLIQALKVALEQAFSPSRSTYDIKTQSPRKPPAPVSQPKQSAEEPLFLEDKDEDTPQLEPQPAPEQSSTNGESFLLGKPHLLTDYSDELTAVSIQDKDRELSIPPRQTSEEESMLGPIESCGPVSPERNPRPSTEKQLITPGEERKSMASPRSSESNDMQEEIPADHPHATTSKDISNSHVPSDDIPSRTTVSTKSPTPSRSVTSGKVQMVLSTANASWNLRRSAEDDSERPLKRHRSNRRISDSHFDPPVSKGNLRQHLLGFAASGSQVVLDDGKNSDRDTASDEDQLQDDDPNSVYGDAHRDISDEDMEMDASYLTPSKNTEQSIEGDPALNLSSHSSHLVDPSMSMIDLTRDIHSDEFDDVHNEQRSTSPAPSAIESASRRPEVIRKPHGEDVSMNLDLSQVTSSWNRLKRRFVITHLATEENGEGSFTRAAIWQDASIKNGTRDDNDKASEALSRVINKSDFSTMGVIGQFNRGFIIVRRRKKDERKLLMDDLFIIDQHAADEKYNFEDLQETTVIESQRLIRPQPLELAASDKLLAIENADVLRRNGFEVEVDEGIMDEGGHRLKLIAQPVSKSTEFNMKDLEEIIHLMHDYPQGHMVRCSKARSMFASRACRKSVMVGMPLNAKQMRTIVRNMGSMNQPWNCPHGRPTMRHLSDILANQETQGTHSSVRRRIVGDIDFDTLVD